MVDNRAIGLDDKYLPPRRTNAKPLLKVSCTNSYALLVLIAEVPASQS